MKKLYLSSLALIITPSLSFAFFCPTNFNQIDFGDSIAQVTETCGKPDVQNEVSQATDNVPQEWSYFIPQNVTSIALSPAEQGTLKTQVTFDANGKAININVNGVGVGSSPICGGRMIQLGDTRENIKAACGDPSFVNKQTTPVGGGAPLPDVKITTFIYNVNPPVKLIFENGILKEKQ